MMCSCSSTLLSSPLSGSNTRRHSTPLTTDGSAHGMIRIASTIPRPRNTLLSVTATIIPSTSSSVTASAT